MPAPKKGKTESHRVLELMNKKSIPERRNIYRTTDTSPTTSLGAGNSAGEEDTQGEVCSRLKDSRNITTKQMTFSGY